VLFLGRCEPRQGLGCREPVLTHRIGRHHLLARGLLIGLRLTVYLGKPIDLAGLKRGCAFDVGPYAPELEARGGSLAAMTERTISARRASAGATGGGGAYPDRERAHTSFPP